MDDMVYEVLDFCCKSISNASVAKRQKMGVSPQVILTSTTKREYIKKLLSNIDYDITKEFLIYESDNHLKNH